MNSKTFVSLLVAGVLGLAAVWVGRELILGKGMSRLGASTAVTKVVVAGHDLDPGEIIDPAEDLKVVEMPTHLVPEKSFTDPKALRERALFYPAAKGQVMFEGMLAKQGAEGGLSALVPAGMRAVSVEVSESSGVSGLLVPGCRVDVIATLRQGDSQMARTIVENAKVQAVGPRLTSKNEDRGPAAKTVTLIVTSKDAESIELASTFGKPRLVLRGTSDSDTSRSTGVTSAELSGMQDDNSTDQEVAPSGWQRFLATLAANSGNTPAAPVRWPVQIIRGEKETTVFYELTQESGPDVGDARVLAKEAAAVKSEVR